MATYEIKKFKSFLGREGYGLNATILKDGKPVAFAMDDASGGDMEVDFTNPLQNAKSFQAHHANAKVEEAAACEWALEWYRTSPDAEHARALTKRLNEQFPDRASEPNGWACLVSWINHTVDSLQAKKRLDALSKKKTLFRLKSEQYEDGEYRTIKAPYDARVQAFLDQKYPGQVACIYGVTA